MQGIVDIERAAIEDLKREGVPVIVEQLVDEVSWDRAEQEGVSPLTDIVAATTPKVA